MARGCVHLWQPRRGYRFNLDSVLVAALAAHHAPPGLMVDAGAGCGAVGLYVARVTGAKVLLLERQRLMTSLCHRNIQHNGLGHATAAVGDFRTLPLGDGSVAALACNPPYRSPDSGRLSPLEQRRLSSHTFHGGMGDVLREAVRVLTPSGCVVVVAPPPLVDAPPPDGLHLVRRLGCTNAEGIETRALAVYARQARSVVLDVRPVHAPTGGFADWVMDVLEGRTRALA